MTYETEEETETVDEYGYSYKVASALILNEISVLAEYSHLIDDESGDLHTWLKLNLNDENNLNLELNFPAITSNDFLGLAEVFRKLYIYSLRQEHMVEAPTEIQEAMVTYNNGL